MTYKQIEKYPKKSIPFYVYEKYYINKRLLRLVLLHYLLQNLSKNNYEIVILLENVSISSTPSTLFVLISSSKSVSNSVCLLLPSEVEGSK